MAHALHHRREFENIRFAYDSKSSHTAAHSSDSYSDHSYHEQSSGSERSYRTQPTEYSTSPSKRPPCIHQNTCDESRPTPHFFQDRQPQSSPAASVETCASTVGSDEDLPEELPEYDVPEYTARPYQSCAIPATPSDFSELFPSHRRLTVRHDDSTLDGNMNLRIDTEVSSLGTRCNMTLFHLRMHDLRSREFSLRRYCRDSGREVCHSSCKTQKPAAQTRPGFQRSLSNALTTMRSKSEHRPPTVASLKRNDSGYASMHSVNFHDDERPRSAGHGAQTSPQLKPDSIKMEFSNYAQVDVKRTKAQKREFEYWGTRFEWKRIARKGGSASYHLTRLGSDRVLAHIMQTLLTASQAEEEQAKGGWVPRCTMWIDDEQIIRRQKDLSDVVISSGLIALVDDSIRARFHSKTAKHLTIPLAKMQIGVDYVGPKRLLNEMFRRDSGSSNHPSRPTSSSRPSTGAVGATSRIPTGGRQSSYE